MLAKIHWRWARIEKWNEIYIYIIFHFRICSFTFVHFNKYFAYNGNGIFRIVRIKISMISYLYLIGRFNLMNLVCINCKCDENASAADGLPRKAFLIASKFVFTTIEIEFFIYANCLSSLIGILVQLLSFNALILLVVFHALSQEWHFFM